MSFCSYVDCGDPVIYACYCDSNELYFCNNHLKTHIKNYPAINHRFQQAFKDTQLEVKKQMKILFCSAFRELDKIKNNALQSASKKIDDINKWVNECMKNTNCIEIDLQDSIMQIFHNQSFLEDELEQIKAKVVSYLNHMKYWISLDDFINPGNQIITKQYIELDELRTSLTLEKSKIEKLEDDLKESIAYYQASILEKDLLIQEIIQSSDDCSKSTKTHFVENENKLNQLEKSLNLIKNKKNWKKHKIDTLIQANSILARFQKDPQSPNFIQKIICKNEKYNPITSCFISDCEWPGGDIVEHLKIYHQSKEFFISKDGAIRYWSARVWKNVDWDISILKLDSGISIIMKSFCDDKAFYIQFYDLETKRIKLKLIFASLETKMQFSLQTESLDELKKEYREVPFCVNLNILEKHMLILSEELEGYKKLCILIEAKNI